MESYSFPKSLIIQNLFLVFILLNPGCSKEDVPPTNGTHDTKATKTIGTSGGTIEIDSFSVTIPPGAFRNDQVLEISVSDKQHPFLDQDVTGLFSVKGIPEEFLEPIIITLKYDGILEEESYLAFGTEQELEESDTTVISFDLLDCTDSSGTLVGKLYPPAQNNAAKRAGGALKGEGKDVPEDLAAFFKGVTGFKTYYAPNSPFSVKYHVTLALNPRFLSLVDYLHLNFGILQDLSSQTEFPFYKIPERVIVYNEQETSNRYGRLPYFYFVTHNKYVEPGKIANEYFAYKIYKEPVDVKVLNRKIGTTFFETLQRHVYYNYDIGYERTPDWFSNASKLWIEEKFLESWGSTDMYIPQGFKEKELTPFIDWSGRGDLSGMVPIVKYFADRYGEGVILLYHHHISKNRSMYDALKLSTGDPSEKWYPEFMRDYLERKIYDVHGILFAKGITSQDDLPMLNSPQSYPEDYDDLTAMIFRFNTDVVSKDNTVVTFSAESQDADPDKIGVLIFSIHRDSYKIEFIADHISDYVEIFNIKDLADQRKDLLAVVVNSETEHLSQIGGDQSNITLKVELNESLPLTYKKFSVDLNHFTGDVHYVDGTVNTFDNIHMRMYMPDAINGKFAGNKFEAKWDEPLDVFNKDSGHVVAPIMEKEGKLELNGFYFHKVSENSESNSRYSYRLMGGNITLGLVEGTGMLAGRVEGIDIDNKLSLFGWEVKLYDEDHSLMDGSYTIRNIKFRPESYLEVYFNEPN